MKFAKHKNIFNFSRRLRRDTGGGPLIEYAIILSVMVVFVAVAWTYTGGQLSTLFTNISSYLTGSSTPSEDDGSGDGSSSDESDQSDDDSDDSDDGGDDDSDDSDED